MYLTQVLFTVVALIGAAMATGFGGAAGGYGAGTHGVGAGAYGVGARGGLGGVPGVGVGARPIPGAGSYGGGYGGGYYGGGQNYPPRPYDFDYQARDEQGNVHYRNEKGDGSGAVRGSYGYTDNQGLYRVVEYVADASGFRANIRTNEPGVDGKESPADVALVAEQPPAGIYDRYTRYGGGYAGAAHGGAGAGAHGAGGAGASWRGGAAAFHGGFAGAHGIGAGVRSGKSGY